MSLKVYRGRTLARSQALQLLFQAEATDSPLERVLEGDFLISKGPLDPYALELCRGAYEHIDRIDCALRAVAKNWDHAHAGADRNLLRIAVYEMRFLTDEEVSDAIVINEAVELAKAYGTDQSASFVNGVLGKIARSEELPGEDLYQELLAEDRAREEAQAAEAAAKVAAAQAAAGVLDEDADAAGAVEADSVEE
ncbi:MAG: transcription antitermination factor NusB [Collinsella sp.]